MLRLLSKVLAAVRIAHNFHFCLNQKRDLCRTLLKNGQMLYIIGVELVVGKESALSIRKSMKASPTMYTKYPLSSIITYNGVTSLLAWWNQPYSWL
jgi:hypothetical protein